MPAGGAVGSGSVGLDGRGFTARLGGSERGSVARLASRLGPRWINPAGRPAGLLGAHAVRRGRGLGSTARVAEPDAPYVGGRVATGPLDHARSQPSVSEPPRNVPSRLPFVLAHPEGAFAFEWCKAIFLFPKRRW